MENGVRNYTIIARKLYNALSSFARRVKMTILISIAVAALPMGISVMMWGYSQQSNQLIYASFGIIGAGFLAWYGAYRECQKENKKTDDFLKLFKAFVSKNGVDVEKVLGRK